MLLAAGFKVISHVFVGRTNAVEITASVRAVSSNTKAQCDNVGVFESC